MVIAFVLLTFSFGIYLFIKYVYSFYPQQLMPIGTQVKIFTPKPEKYMDDCLHPCIRYIPEGFMGHKWWMVQSPYYGRNNKLENPILYYSEDTAFPTQWKACAIIQETPQTGFNSDPTLFYEDHKLWIFWRECQTPLCNTLQVPMATVGVSTLDGIHFSDTEVYLTNKDATTDNEQCPILIKRNNKYYFYAAHYQYKPVRKNLGIAIWEGNSLENPDFILRKTTSLPKTYTCDKYKQFKFANNLLFIPKPLKHDVWHFDLFEYNNRLYMFSVAEWGDNIMLNVADDYENFKTIRKPLINSHYSERFLNYRSYFYKPTGYIKNNTIYLYYTSTGKFDVKKNELFFSKGKLPIY